jgi:predicted nucleic acid-binding protein
MRIYLDAAPIIYLVEQVIPQAAIVDARISPAGIERVASHLTRMECRVKPLRGGDQALLLDFDTFFAASIAEFVLLSQSVVDRATEIRAQYGFKTPDAIHLAAAIESACDLFLTNDQQLTRFSGIAVEVV